MKGVTNEHLKKKIN